MKRASSRRLDAERADKCDHRLSKKLGRGEHEPAGTRGACEQESASQGSEAETPPVLSRAKR